MPNQQEIQFSLGNKSKDPSEHLDEFIDVNFELRRLIEEGALDPKIAIETITSLIKNAQAVYPKRYHLRPPLHEAFVWKDPFPSLDENFVPDLAEETISPQWAEGLLVVPKPTEISGLEKGNDFLSHWCSAKVRVLQLLERSFPHVVHWMKHECGETYERLTPATALVLEHLCRHTPGDFLILPFQSGRRWRNRSVERLHECFAPGEFGLCSYLVACLLYAHPERLSGSSEALNIVCPGERRRPDEHSLYIWVPFFAFIKDELNYHSQVDWWNENQYSGAATGYCMIEKP